MVTFATGGNFEVTLTHGIAGCPLLDMRQAPRKWGPLPQSPLHQIFAAWEEAVRHIGVLACADPIQTMILRQAFKITAPTCGRIFAADEQAAAEGWCRLAPAPPALK